MLKTLLAGVGILAVVTVSAVVLNADGGHFADENPPPRLKVSFAGLDLATPEGKRLLDDRIRTAIDEICGLDRRSVFSRPALEAKCRANAWAGTRPQVGRAIARAERGHHFYGDSGPAADPVTADLGRLPGGMRSEILAAMSRSFSTGRSANWQTWRAHGFVSVSNAVSYGDYACRTVAVYNRAEGEYQVVTQGTACRSPEGDIGPPPLS